MFIPMPVSKFVEIYPKILSEAALCLAVFVLHCFIEGETCSGNLLQLDEGFDGFNQMKRQVSLLGLKK